jgi:dolichyl-phosphate-mannose--protein O-mannosyl transferase
LRYLWQRFNRPVVAVLAVGLIAGYLRFMHLAYPEHRVFDEYYYTKSACILLGYSDQRCDINSADERFWRENEWDTGAWVHPPLGKWMIAAGEAVFGTESLGWRAGAAAAGTATVMLLAVIIQLLSQAPSGRSRAACCCHGSLNLVQSRTGTLDIFVAFWVVLVFVFLLLDRRWIEDRPATALHRGRRRSESTGQAEASSAHPLWRSVPVRRRGGVGRRDGHEVAG